MISGWIVSVPDISHPLFSTICRVLVGSLFPQPEIPPVFRFFRKYPEKTNPCAIFPTIGKNYGLEQNGHFAVGIERDAAKKSSDFECISLLQRNTLNSNSVCFAIETLALCVAVLLRNFQDGFYRFIPRALMREFKVEAFIPSNWAAPRLPLICQLAWVKARNRFSRSSCSSSSAV
jgi:hypothetical protein